METTYCLAKLVQLAVCKSVIHACRGNIQLDYVLLSVMNKHRKK
jgi:hypothetical protein